MGFKVGSRVMSDFHQNGKFETCTVTGVGEDGESYTLVSDSGAYDGNVSADHVREMSTEDEGAPVA